MNGTLYATLTRAALHQRLSLTLRVLLRAVALFALCLVVAFAADNLFNLSAPVRAVIALSLVGSVIGGLASLYFRYWHKAIDTSRTAVYLEQRYGITDNRLINAVHFDRDPAIPGFMKSLFTGAAETACAGMRFRRVWQHARLIPAARLFALGALVLFAYLIPFKEHAQNALLRYLNPKTSVMPLSFTQFNVSPGDTELIEGSPCLIHASATKFDRPVGRLEILIQDGTTPLLYTMKASAGSFAFELNDLSRTVRYAVKHGNDRSRWHTLTVIQHPRLDQLTVTVTPPAYTGDPPQLISPSKREADILAGSRIHIRSGASARQHIAFYRDGTLVTPHAEPPQAAIRPVSGEIEFELLADTAVSLDVKDTRGHTHAGVWQCRFTRVGDKIPDVRFLNRELNVEAGVGHSLPLTLEASDDFGLTSLEFFTVLNQKERTLKKISFREIRRTRTETSALNVAAELFVRNASYKIWARVYDNHQPPQPATVLTPLTLHIVDFAKEVPAGDKDDPYVQLFTALTEALDQQKDLRDWVAAKIENDRKERIGAVLHKRQQVIHDRIVLGSSLASELVTKKKIKQGLADSIAELLRARSEPLIHQIPATIKLGDAQRQAGLNDIVLQQSALIIALQRILGRISSDNALAALKEQQASMENQDQKLFDKLQKLKNDLSAFKDEQRKILDQTEAIDKKPPEDWTEAEEQLLGDLAAKQHEFAKFFRAAFNDLSKLENQDFSNSAMADELIEMIEELQKAGAALEKRHIEIATVNEELLGEQAESIESNLERWLADAKDYIKWTGEEGGVNPDVPLQDLPDELTDLIGELIDDVADMEDVEDSSNSSLSAFDKGIGWGTSDGNMDDMSAKGVTGNAMPNNNEVGGRSGEGRSGKSSGQFVEKEATGKGGRDTPTRLVQSPFERGTVKDTSKDPQGGATGGGKQSGLGGEGLRGITPDQKPDVQQRLPGKQAELKQKAEALMRELNVRNLPTGDLEAAVNKMELIQKYRAAGQGLQVKQVQSELASTLKDARAVIQAGTVGGAEKGKAISRKISTIRHTGNEPTPAGYEESVDAYFRALAEPQDNE